MVNFESEETPKTCALITALNMLFSVALAKLSCVLFSYFATMVGLSMQRYLRTCKCEKNQNCTALNKASSVVV